MRNLRPHSLSQLRWLGVIFPALLLCVVRYHSLVSSTATPKLLEDGIGTIGWIEEIRETVQHDGLLAGPIDMFSPTGIGGGLFEPRPISPLWKVYLWLTPPSIPAPVLYNVWLLLSIALNLTCAFLLARILKLSPLATAAALLMIVCLENTDKRLGGHLGFVGMWGPLLLVCAAARESRSEGYLRYGLLACGVIAAFLNNEYYGFHGLVVASAFVALDAAHRLRSGTRPRSIVKGWLGFAAGGGLLMLLFFPYTTTGMVGLGKFTFIALRNRASPNSALAGHPLGDFENYGTSSVFSLFAPPEHSPLAPLFPLDLELWEHSFRTGPVLMVCLAGLLLLRVLILRRQTSPGAIQLPSTTLLLAFITVSALIALKLSHPLSPALLFHKVAPMFRVSARAMVYGAIGAVFLWGRGATILFDRMNQGLPAKRRAVALAVWVGLTALIVADIKGFRPDGFHRLKTATLDVPEALRFLSKEPRGMVINFPFHFRPKDPPEFCYDYFFGRAFHHKPIVDGVEFYGHGEAHARFEGAGRLRNVSLLMQQELRGSGVRYLILWGDFAKGFEQGGAWYEPIYSDQTATVYRALGPEIPYSSERFARSFLLW